MKKVLVILAFASCTKQATTGHNCPFSLCPYKGYAHFPGVIETGGTGVNHAYDKTTVYTLDSLHFVYPGADYDSLENLTTK